MSNGEEKENNIVRHHTYGDEKFINDDYKIREINYNEDEINSMVLEKKKIEENKITKILFDVNEAKDYNIIYDLINDLNSKNIFMTYKAELFYKREELPFKYFSSTNAFNSIYYDGNRFCCSKRCFKIPRDQVDGLACKKCNSFCYCTCKCILFNYFRKFHQIEINMYRTKAIFIDDCSSYDDCY